MNYEKEEDIDPPDMNEPIEYEEPAPYDSNIEESEDNADAAADDSALIEPDFEVAPYEQDDSTNEEQLMIFHLLTKVIMQTAAIMMITTQRMILMMQMSAMIGKKKTAHMSLAKKTADMSASL